MHDLIITRYHMSTAGKDSELEIRVYSPRGSYALIFGVMLRFSIRMLKGRH